MNFENAVILRNKRNEQTDRAAKELAEKLERSGVEVVTVEEAGRKTAAFVLGGDGTVLRAAGELVGKGVGIVGINFGHLGFLSPYDSSEIDLVIDRLFVKKEFTLVERHFLNVNGPFGERLAFNEFLIHRDVLSHMLTITVRADGSKIGEVLCDGIILSTPTGSTAYNLSAGGPVVDPLADVITVVPMMAHTFSEGAIVISSGRKIRIEVHPRENERYFAIADGNGINDYDSARSFDIEFSDRSLKFVCTKDRDFFGLIHKKLRWGVRNGFKEEER